MAQGDGLNPRLEVVDATAAAADPVFLYAYNGATWERFRTVNALDPGFAAAGLVAIQGIVPDNLGDSSAGNFSLFGWLRDRAVSAVNTQLQKVYRLRNLHDTLTIHSAASAGTATLTVEVSSDNVNWLTIDSLAAVATQVKQYTATTVGATVALSPLAFMWIRITAGAAGVGNTTTLTVAAK